MFIAEKSDSILNEIHRGDLVILAARPGMGKTSFAVNMAWRLSAIYDKTIAFFSMEISREMLVSKLISVGNCFGLGVNISNIHLVDTPGISVSEIKEILTELHHMDYVFIDYLQLISYREGLARENVSGIVSRLKKIAEELDTTIICLSQLSCALEQRDDHRPRISDLRKEVEQSADSVLFLYRDDYFNAEASEKDVIECMIAKNKHGDAITLRYHIVKPGLNDLLSGDKNCDIMPGSGVAK